MYISPAVLYKTLRELVSAVTDLQRTDGIAQAARVTITATIDGYSHDCPIPEHVTVSTTCDTTSPGLRFEPYAGRFGLCHADAVKPGDIVMFPSREVDTVGAGDDTTTRTMLGFSDSPAEAHDIDDVLVIFRPDPGYGRHNDRCQQCDAEAGRACDPMCTALPAMEMALIEHLRTNHLILDVS